MFSEILDKRICDIDKSSKDTFTYREYIHDMVRVFYGDRYSKDEIDEKLSEASADEIYDLISELNWMWSE